MTFLFDIGRVLLDFDLEGSLARLLEPGVADGPARIAALLERKDEFEAGHMEPDDFVAWSLGVLGSDATADAFCEAWRRIFTPVPAMWNCVKDLHAGGHRLLLFSNTNAIHCPWVFDAYPDFRLFHGAVLSFEARCVKPERGIYQHAIDRHGLDPAATIYIDDLAANVATGREVGFRCWQYDLNNHAAFAEWLQGFGLHGPAI